MFLTTERHPLLKQAYALAKTSPDPSTQNAALLLNPRVGRVYAEDINRPPDGILMTPARWECPLKYKIVEHAERNVIFQATRYGRSTEGSIMICPWAACADCARAIIQSGIIALVTHKQAHDRSPAFWKQEINIAFELLREAGVEIIMYDGIIGVSGLRHSGILWNP